MDLYTYLDSSSLLILEDIFLGALCLLSMDCFGKIISRSSGFFTRVTLGVSLVGSLVSLLIGINAQLGRKLVILSVIVGVLLKIREIFLADKKIVWNSQLKFYFCLLAGVIILCSIFSRLHLTEDGGILVNAHEGYYLGIPLEINKADYSSRLRVFNYYPGQWSRYHFFSSSLLVIPMTFMSQQNILGFLLSKSLIILVFVGSILEGMKLDIRAAVRFVTIYILVLFCVFHEATKWSISTNNYLSVFFLILLFQSLMYREISNAILYSLLLSLSASRMVVPGMAIFLFILIKNRFSLINAMKRDLIKSLVVGTVISILLISISATLYLGKIPANFVSPFRNLYNFAYRGFITPSFLFDSPDWQLSMSSTTGLISVLAKTHLFSESLDKREVLVLQLNSVSLITRLTSLLFWCIVLFLLSKKFIVNRKSCVNQFNIQISQSRTKAITIGILLVGSMFWFTYTLSRDSENIFWPIFLTLLPMLSLVLLSPKDIRVPLVIYLIAAYALVPITDTSIWTPAVSLPEFLLPFFTVIRIQNKIINWQSNKKSVRIIALLGVAMISILSSIDLYIPEKFDSTTHVIHATREVKKNEIICNDVEESERSLLSLAGYRIAADSTQNDRFNVTQNFAYLNASNLELLHKICPSNS